MKKIIAVLMAAMLGATMLTGCGKSNNAAQVDENGNPIAQIDRKTMEMQQNDYRGGITRMQAVQASVIEVMETMKGNNVIIREDSPNSFWSNKDYQDFVATFLDTPIIADTCWFNEEEGDWETTLKMMCSVKNNLNVPTDDGGFKLACTVTRNEKDDYTASGIRDNKFLVTVNGRVTTYTGEAQYRVLYDCDKDWCKAYKTQTIDKDLPDTTIDMIEYMRVDDNTFVVQTSRERLMVILKPAESDTDLRDREVKEFYYSKLVKEGMRTTFEPYVPLPEADEAMEVELKDNIKKNQYMSDFKGFNENGDFAILYGQHDSVFFRSPAEITPENFVFEDKSLQQAICYKDGVLVVTTYNKLSANYERFTYALKGADGKIADNLEKMVAINKLVGIQEIPEENPEIETSDKKDSSNTDVSKETDKETDEKPAESEKPADDASEEVTGTTAETPNDTENSEAVTETTAEAQADEPEAE